MGASHRRSVQNVLLNNAREGQAREYTPCLVSVDIMLEALYL